MNKEIKEKEPEESEFKEKITVGKLSIPQLVAKEGRTAEDIRLIIEEWLKPEHIDRKTRLNSRQVKAVATLQSLAITYEIETLERWLNVFQTKKLSEDGQSSKELENILKARIPEITQDNTLTGKIGKFLE